ncbi:MAG TPA: BrnT family toxin [Bauldia sp.]|nr:BrnT family toxin [Bauldia sp.]
MEFEWDDEKRARTLRERGLDFETAAPIFAETFFEFVDERRDYGEERLVAIGAVGEEVLVVVSTMRGGVRRIISARRANRKERELWRLFARP